MTLVRNNNSPDGRTVSGWAEIHAQRRADAESNGGASGAGVYSDMADDNRIERIIRPIVEGQIRSFLHDHPEVAEGWTGKCSHKTRAEAVKDSLAKRIVRDLVCPETRVRLERALLPVLSGAPGEARVELRLPALVADLAATTGSAALASLFPTPTQGTEE